MLIEGMLTRRGNPLSGIEAALNNIGDALNKKVSVVDITVAVPVVMLKEIEEGMELAIDVLHQKMKENKMQDNKYHFVSSEEDVDYLRILRETPTNTMFVLVEEKSRTNKPRKWSLFVHLSVLHNDQAQGKCLCGLKVNPNWGITSLPHSEDFPYRYISRVGKFPGIIKQEIERLRRGKSPKNTITKVTYA